VYNVATKAYNVSTVNLTSLDAACTGKTVSVTVSDAAGNRSAASPTVCPARPCRVWRWVRRSGCSNRGAEGSLEIPPSSGFLAKLRVFIALLPSRTLCLSD
jgi:hypothetical protein